MGYERLWERLLKALNDGSTAVEVAPGRVVVTTSERDEPAREVEIVMTHREWDDMATVVWGNPASAVDYVKRLVREVGPGERFLVYETYDLVASATAELPVDPDDLPPRGLPPGTGRWVAFDRDGNVLDEFGHG